MLIKTNNFPLTRVTERNTLIRMISLTLICTIKRILNKFSCQMGFFRTKTRSMYRHVFSGNSRVAVPPLPTSQRRPRNFGEVFINGFYQLGMDPRFPKNFYTIRYIHIRLFQLWRPLFSKFIAADNSVNQKLFVFYHHA